MDATISSHRIQNGLWLAHRRKPRTIFAQSLWPCRYHLTLFVKGSFWVFRPVASYWWWSHAVVLCHSRQHLKQRYNLWPSCTAAETAQASSLDPKDPPPPVWDHSCHIAGLTYTTGVLNMSSILVLWASCLRSPKWQQSRTLPTERRKGCGIHCDMTVNFTVHQFSSEKHSEFHTHFSLSFRSK
jgi:hypothetical protein